MDFWWISGGSGGFLVDCGEFLVDSQLGWIAGGFMVDLVDLVDYWWIVVDFWWIASRFLVDLVDMWWIVVDFWCICRFVINYS